jgi:hypothetical protein
MSLKNTVLGFSSTPDAISVLKRWGLGKNVSSIRYLYGPGWKSPVQWGIFASEGAYVIRSEMLSSTRLGGEAEPKASVGSVATMTKGTASQWRRVFRSATAARLEGRPEGAALWSTLHDAGWHFSSFGGVAAVRVWVDR